MKRFGGEEGFRPRGRFRYRFLGRQRGWIRISLAIEGGLGLESRHPLGQVGL